MTSIMQGTASKFKSAQGQFALLKQQKDFGNIKGARRGRLDIIAEILLFCEQQKTKTSIMYNANLNYSQLRRHMDALTAQGLLEKKATKFITTEKGYHFLDLFAQLNDLLADFNP